MSQSESFDLCVIGAGIIGLATARAVLQQRSLSLLVLEAEERPATHQTGNNSGVIHSGLYYEPGSLKAQLCSTGRAALVSYCQERALDFEICGKIVVATSAEELPRLDELERRGRANGLEGIERLGPQGLREHEPNVVGVAGLWVPETGIVDYGAVSLAFAQDIATGGGEVRLSCAAGALRHGPDGFTIETPRGTVHARQLINCGGVQADRIARRAGLRPRARIVPFRGEYKLLRPLSRGLVRNLIYPVPNPRLPFLGVHFTRGVNGEVEAGPNAVLAFHRHGYRWRDVSPRDLASMASYPGFWRMAARYWRTAAGEVHRSLSHSAFTHALQHLMPSIGPDDLIAGGAGVRAQLLDPDGSFADDFRFEKGPHALHVLCAPSPAATASIAIGEYVANEAAQHFGYRARGTG